jgi:hypothetical protein
MGGTWYGSQTVENPTTWVIKTAFKLSPDAALKSDAIGTNIAGTPGIVEKKPSNMAVPLRTKKPLNGSSGARLDAFTIRSLINVPKPVSATTAPTPIIPATYSKGLIGTFSLKVSDEMTPNKGTRHRMPTPKEIQAGAIPCILSVDHNNRATIKKSKSRRSSELKVVVIIGAVG